MSSLYEQWKPSVGDRVRIVMRDEEGPVLDTGTTGTIVAVHPDAPEALCEVEHDAQPGKPTKRDRYAAEELEPIEQTAARAPERGQRENIGQGTATGGDWQPTVGDWVMVASNGRRAVITAIDQRGGQTVCEVEYDHRPGETADPQRDNFPLRELEPTREPSAEALEAGDRR